LKPHSFETFHLRPHLPETSSFEITFILHHVKMKLFWFTVYQIFVISFHFFAGDLKFCKVSIHLKFCKVIPFCVQRWLTLGCKYTCTLKDRRDEKTLHTLGLEGALHIW